MPPVVEVLSLIQREGITLTLDGEDLIARPTAAVSAEIVATLKENKAAIIRILRTRMRTVATASDLGLVARWSRAFGYISIHDPTTGEWHDVRTEDAPGWAKWEAHKRKELWRDGDGHAYELTARDMEEIWEAERQGKEGIVEDHPLEEED